LMFAYEVSVVVRCTLFAVVNVRWTTKFGAGTSANKEYWKSKAASNSPVYFLRGIRAYDELRIVVTEVLQIKQTLTRSI